MSQSYATNYLSSSTSINFTLLDQFCVDYLYYEGLTKENATVRGSQYDKFKPDLEMLSVSNWPLEDCCVPSSFDQLPEDSYVRDFLSSITQQVRQHILDGHITVAIDLVNTIHPDFLKTHPKLAFRLCKQQFIELIRTHPTDSTTPLAYLQDHLVPLAQASSANPEGELKRVMMCLVYGSAQWQNSSQKNWMEGGEWSPSKLVSVASRLSRCLLRYLHVQEPRLTLAARYLCIVHNMYHAIRGENSSVPETEELLLPDAEEQEDEDDYIEDEEEEIEEDDVNILAQMTLLPHSKARRALILAHGSLPAAFVASLSRMCVSRPLVASLVTEYCAYRGLLAGRQRDDEKGEDEVPTDLESGEEKAKECSVELKAADIAGCAGLNMSFWKIHDLITFVNNYRPAPHARPLATLILEELHALGFDRPYMRIYAAQREGGGIVVDIDEKEADTPISPQLYFALRRCEFVEQLRAGEWDGAVKVVREGMSPLTFHDPTLIQPLKDTVMLLAYRGARTVPPGLAQRFLRGCGVDEWVEANAGSAGLEIDTKLEKKKEASVGGIEAVVEEIWRKFNPHTLAGSLYAALSTHLGLPEPALVRVMTGLLEVHTKWCQHDDDRYVRVFVVMCLSLSYARCCIEPRLLDPGSIHAAITGTEGGAGGAAGQGINTRDARRNGLNEVDITTVQDVMACTRYKAIDLLLEHGGCAEDVLHALFG
ncbi:hypothetical protein BC937DRAFT_90396 [Endogone sp. FLAS-F59071]|nr:hypothetical protein BC937DRAFT_90396 [Endogone sp. FLAS-F59071]|eukprot:RUS17121.1 hypothetical protein BC937DRAFT_90396 [Endogone sp. FLAS-F59071]